MPMPAPLSLSKLPFPDDSFFILMLAQVCRLRTPLCRCQHLYFDDRSRLIPMSAPLCQCQLPDVYVSSIIPKPAPVCRCQSHCADTSSIIPKPAPLCQCQLPCADASLKFYVRPFLHAFVHPNLNYDTHNI